MTPPRGTHIKRVPAAVTIMISSKQESNAIPVIRGGGP
jgi:hypothetical protein